MSKKVKAEDVGAELTAHHDRVQERAQQAAHRAALKGEAIVSAATPVDTGRARSGWKVVPTDDGANLINSVPYIGVLEVGSRPHWPPRDPIMRWVVRQEGTKGGQKGKRSFESTAEVSSEIKSKTFLVRRAIAESGTEAHFMVRNNLDRLRRILRQETERMLRGL